MRRPHRLCFWFLVLLLAACRPSRILVSPVPPELESLQGHASLTLTSDQGSDRTKFSFLLDLPDRGWIEVSNFIGQTLYCIVIRDRKAYLVIPSRKVYWKAPEAEIIHKFLGFRLNLNEVIALFSGTWPTDAAVEEWTLDRDSEGRILSGRRDELHFIVEEFIQDTRFPLRLRFVHPLSSGRLRIRKMEFNRAVGPQVFATEFLEEYVPATWDEIQDLIHDAD